MKKSEAYIVTGPGIEDRKAESAGHGRSLATTFASEAKTEATFYVRDPNGNIVGRAERDERGGILIYDTEKVAK